MESWILCKCTNHILRHTIITAVSHIPLPFSCTKAFDASVQSGEGASIDVGYGPFHLASNLWGVALAPAPDHLVGTPSPGLCDHTSVSFTAVVLSNYPFHLCHLLPHGEHVRHHVSQRTSKGPRTALPYNSSKNPVDAWGTSRYAKRRYGIILSQSFPSSTAAFLRSDLRVLLKRSTSPSVCGW